MPSLLGLGLIGGHLGSALAHVVDGAGKAERLLGDVVALAVDDRGKRADSVLDAHVAAGIARELLRHVERLGQELLDLTGTVDDKALLLRELVHAENRDDVLEVRVLLQQLLDGRGDAVVLLADDARVEGVR